jgi:hypothetical protein
MFNLPSGAGYFGKISSACGDMKFNTQNEERTSIRINTRANIPACFLHTICKN